MQSYKATVRLQYRMVNKHVTFMNKIPEELSNLEVKEILVSIITAHLLEIITNKDTQVFMSFAHHRNTNKIIINDH